MLSPISAGQAHGDCSADGDLQKTGEATIVNVRNFALWQN
jgi:hypothetical protein